MFYLHYIFLDQLHLFRLNQPNDIISLIHKILCLYCGLLFCYFSRGFCRDRECPVSAKTPGYFIETPAGVFVQRRTAVRLYSTFRPLQLLNYSNTQLLNYSITQLLTSPLLSPAFSDPPHIPFPVRQKRE